jgi:hypothetical protein
MPTTTQTSPTEPLALAPGFAVVASGAVLLLGAWRWGLPGVGAAALGVALSLINVWALVRSATAATALAAAGWPRTATAQLTSALAGKTAVLFVAVWLVARSGKIAVLPFACGLLVSVFSLLGAGLWSARAEK